jgi:Zn-dependent protease with chaperone function
MDFFARQDHARRRTGRLVVLYLLAVLGTVLLVYFVPAVLWTFWGAASTTEAQLPVLFWWHPTLFGIVFLSTIVIVSTAALMKISHLRSEGGAGVALLMGGRELLPTVEGFFERRLRNVVEEMAIASGTSVPRVFVMDRETGINAFAAGYSPSDAAVAVSRGAMEALTRDELQGVVAHVCRHDVLPDDQSRGLTFAGTVGRCGGGSVYPESAGAGRSLDKNRTD